MRKTHNKTVKQEKKINEGVLRNKMNDLTFSGVTCMRRQRVKICCFLYSNTLLYSHAPTVLLHAD